jgi:hypothetical protein
MTMQMTNNSGIKSTASFQIIPNIAQLKTLKVRITKIIHQFSDQWKLKRFGESSASANNKPECKEYSISFYI